MSTESNRTEILKFNDIEIFYIDFKGLKLVEEFQVVMEESAQFIRSQPSHSVYTLTDISGMRFNSDVKNEIQEFVKGNRPYVKAGCVVGVSGLLSIMFNAIMKVTGRDLKAVGSIQEGKEWILMNHNNRQ